MVARVAHRSTHIILFFWLNRKLSMSSAPLSSKKNLFVQSQGHYSTPTPSVTGNTNPNLFRRSLVSSPSPSSPTTTLIRGPKPFYRSRVTPDPFDYSNSTRRQSDSSDYAQPSSQRRFSVNQLNGTSKFSCSDLEKNRRERNGMKWKHCLYIIMELIEAWRMQISPMMNHMPFLCKLPV